MNTIDYVHRFISSLVFTTAIETLFLFILLYLIFKRRDLLKTEVLFAGILASFATIPYVWFVFPYVVDWPRQTSLYWSEPIIFLIEAFIYNRLLKLNWKVALTVSLVCNLASYLIGPLLRSAGLWIYW